MGQQWYRAPDGTLGTFDEGASIPDNFKPVPAPTDSGWLGSMLGSAEKAFGGAYKSVAQPVRDYFQGPANNLVRAPYEIVTGQRPLFTGLKAPEQYQTPPTSALGKVAADIVNPIPEDLAQLGLILGTAGMSKYGAAGRILGAAAGTGIGSNLQGDDQSEQALRAALAGGVTAGMEGAGAGYAGLRRWWGKNVINEQQSQKLLSILDRINPDAADAVRAQPPPEAGISGSPTIAKMNQAANRGDIQQAISDRFQGQVDQIRAMDYDPHYPLTGQLKLLWDQIPEADKLAFNLTPRPPVQATRFASNVPSPSLGSTAYPGPQTYNVQPEALNLDQMLEMRRYFGDKAFDGLKVNPTMEKFRDMTSGLIQGELSPSGQAAMGTANAQYGGAKAIEDFLTKPNAVTGMPNTMYLNRNSFSDYMNREARGLRARLGDEWYDQLVGDVLGGAQPGTKDILVSGTGSPVDALYRVWGRMTGGAPSSVGSLLHIIAPNFGSEYTGRQPFQMLPELQTAIDAAASRSAQEQGDQWRQQLEQASFVSPAGAAELETPTPPDAKRMILIMTPNGPMEVPEQ